MKAIASLIAISLISQVSSLIAEEEKFSIPNPFVQRIQKAKPATMKVLIGEEIEGALIEVKGPYTVIDPLNSMQVSSGSFGKRFFLFAHPNGIKWGEEFLGIFQIRLIPADPETSIFVNGIQYRGCVEIYYVNDRINIINEVDVESYLKSTLTLQFENMFDDEVMNAVAIVARTNAYFASFRNRDALWHVKADETGYQGYGLTLQNLDLERAIESTRSLILTFEGEPFATAWTANSAGKTAHYQTIFRKNVNAPNPVKSHYALKDREASHWSFIVDKTELARLFKLGRISGAELYVDQESGKSYALRLRDGVHFKDVDFFTLQDGLGSDRLKSNDFTIDIKNDKILFSGYGEGCGVGLCLYSAKVMAQHGDSTPKILSAFFPGTKLQKMKNVQEADECIATEATLPVKGVKNR